MLGKTRSELVRELIHSGLEERPMGRRIGHLKGPRPAVAQDRMAATDQGTQLAMKTWLIDTGPLVAYLNRTDAMHGRVAACLDEFAGHLCTTSAVITEAMYFLSDVQAGPLSFAELVHASAMRIAESTQPPAIRAAADLMGKYADTPMDFADASLVLLAETRSRWAGVHEQVRIGRQPMAQVDAREGRAAAQMKRRHALDCLN